MFEGSSNRQEWLSWALVIIWSGLIFLTVPYARDWFEFVRHHWGAEIVTYLVAACVVLVLAAAVALLRIRRRKSVLGHAWLMGIAGIVIYRTFDLAAGAAVEAIHFLQYGMLSYLLFRALAHRVRDYGIYAAATIAGSIVGMIDETIQWLTPGRYFALQDIWLNFTAVALLQIALAAGIRPPSISGWPDGAGLRRLSRLGAVAIAYLGLCYLNTPDRISWYSTRVPLPDFITEVTSVMVEYGYLHGDPAGGRFRSRLTAEELRRYDRDRAVEGARILDKFRDPKRYDEFLATYTPMNDPFLHEAGVHLYSRNANLQRARRATDEKPRRRHFANAYWENRILEENFGGMLRQSSSRWPAGFASGIKEKMDTGWVIKSRVSRHLITAYTRQQAFWFFLCAVVGLLLLGRYFAQRRSTHGYGAQRDE